MGERRYYRPVPRGLEIRIAEKLERLRELDHRARGGDGPGVGRRGVLRRGPLAIDPQVQAALDHLLLEQGGYEPLDLLLAQGLLLYTDYEDWRAGELPRLEERLQGPGVKALLEQAGRYARALGLESEPRIYRDWTGDDAGGRELAFSRDAQRQQAFARRYCKPADAPQLDLFMDTGETLLANGVIQALGERDLRGAARQLQRLAATNPAHAQRADLEQLLEAARSAREPAADPSAALADLEQRLLPLAERRLGGYARHFLPPLWRRLTQALDGCRFDPAHPERHPSYPALRAEDWREVVELVESEPNWHCQPYLLRRHARACGRLRRDTEALWSWFQLCWGWPDQADAFGREAEPAWRRDWPAFLDLEPELAWSEFPAWLLLHHPALARALPEAEVPEAGAGFRQVRALLSLPADRLDQDLIDCRAALKQTHPGLFHHYLARRWGP